MNAVLRRVLERAELGGPAEVFSRQEVRLWAPGSLEALVAAGILVPDERAEQIVYGGCDRECIIHADFSQPPTPRPGGGAVALHRCTHGCGLVTLAPEEFDRWRFDLLGLAGAVAAATGAAGFPVVDVYQRLALAGTVVVMGIVRDVFVGVGLGRDDARSVLRHADRLMASTAPLVLCAAAMPSRLAWSGMLPATAVLAEHVSFRGARIALDVAPLFSLPTEAHAAWRSTDWIKVTDAAKRLMEDIPKLDLRAAKARVSRGADDDQFVTNGEKGRSRRIDPTSFDAWRLSQRDADLDKHDSLVESKPRRRRRLAGGFGAH